MKANKKQTNFRFDYLFIFILNNCIMDFYDKLLIEKNANKLNNKDLGSIIQMDGEAFRMAVKRKSLKLLQIQELEKFFENKQNHVNEPREDYVVKRNNIPVYNVDFIAGNINVFDDIKTDLIGYLNIPELKGSEMVIIARGDSMLGVIDSGDFIGIKKITDFSFFNYGSPYAIVTEDYRLLKFIRKSENPDNVVLRSNNPNYDDIELPKTKIIELYLITACLPFSKIKMFM